MKIQLKIKQILRVRKKLGQIMAKNLFKMIKINQLISRVALNNRKKIKLTAKFNGKLNKNYFYLKMKKKEEIYFK